MNSNVSKALVKTINASGSIVQLPEVAITVGLNKRHTKKFKKKSWRMRFSHGMLKIYNIFPEISKVTCMCTGVYRLRKDLRRP